MAAEEMQPCASAPAQCDVHVLEGGVRKVLVQLHGPEVGDVDVARAEMAMAVPTPARSAAEDKAPGIAGVGHIRVAVRVRPVPIGEDSIIEVAGEGAIAIRKEAATGGNEWLSSQQGRTEERKFDRVFGPMVSQAEVYAWSCQPLVRIAVEEGRHATAFVYGATGAGKTHTMFGEREEAQHGLIIRSIREVFAAVDARARNRCDQLPLEVKVSFLDIYNETVRDLLQEEGSACCKVLEDERRGVVKVTNLREVPCQNVDDALRQLQFGKQARKVEATAANARSSRSHAVFSLTLERIEAGVALTSGDPVFRRRSADIRRLHSKISLIDLAGSERATQTQNTGSALKDGAKINQSLLALANCIDALVCRGPGREGVQQTPRKKPPYRDSKLTLLLKASLTSDCLVSMIANVHPGRDHFEDSNNTLEYAKRASAIKASRSSSRTWSACEAPVSAHRLRAASLPSSRPASPSPPSSPVDATAGGGTTAPSKRVAGVAPSNHIERPRQRRATVESRVPDRRQDVARATSSVSKQRAATPEVRGLTMMRGTTVRRVASAMPTCQAGHMHSAPNERRGARCSSACRYSNATHYESPASQSSSYGTGNPDSGQVSPQGFSDAFLTAPTSPTHEGFSSEPSREASPKRASVVLGQQSADTRCVSPESAKVRRFIQLQQCDEGEDSKAGASSGHRPSRHAASPELARRGVASPSPRRGGFCFNALHSSPLGANSPSETLLMRIIDSLQAEKASLDGELNVVQKERDRLQVENARLRASNLEKDRQLAAVLRNLRIGDNASESISMQLGGLSPNST